MAVKTTEVRSQITASDKTRKAYQGATANAKKMAKGTTGAIASIAKAWRGASLAAKVGAAAMVAAGTAAFLLADKTAEAEDQIGKFAGRLNISVEELTRYRHVAELSGVSTEDLEKSFQKLPKSVADAAKGLAAPRDALAKLNLEADVLKQLDPIQQFEAISSALQGVANTSDRVQIAQDLMGRGGVKMLGIINQGTAAIEGMKEEADALGITLSTTSAMNAAEYEDTMTRLQGLVKGISRDIADDLIPVITDVAKSITAWVADNEELIKQGLAQTINFLGDSIKTVINLVDGFTRDFTMGEKFAETSEQLTIMAETGVLSVEEVTKALFNADKANKIFQGGILEQGELSEGQLHAILALMEEGRSRMADGGEALDPGAAAVEEEVPVEEDPEVLRHAAIIQAKAELDLLGVEEELALQEQVLKMKLSAEKKAIADKKKLEKVESTMRKNSIRGVQGMLAQIGKDSKTAAKASFELNKGLAIARTIQDGKSAAIKAYADLGPIAGTAAALLIGLITVAAVASIAGTSMEGGGGGGADVGGGGVAGGIPSAGPAGTPEGADIPEVEEDNRPIINLTIETMDPTTVLDKMKDSIDEYALDGKFVNIQVKEAI